ncbi:MAG TPA: ABC-2 transporter permease [Candidatus Eisenbergiella merdavium]|uniref:ABC-2 transporter permease n=1 Tax=Candidatus Eisenbergiella merdavium TaxID=2838551 RepID=A0A9D2NI84_9FIRM|nr:ABC-2 transporter permease [Candidatus Eisenbergiella merdavium]
MKGLLLKDFYMAEKYCRAFFLIVVVFFGISLLGSASFFLLVYPCILMGLIPSSLLSYDEREKWDVYSGTLPCTRAQLVSGKYLTGLLGELPVILLTVALYGVSQARTGAFDPAVLARMAGVMLLLGLIGPATTLPFLFRFGSEKGRIAYFAVIVFLCAACGALNSIPLSTGENDLGSWLMLPSAGASLAVAAAAVLLYALSWRLSIAFYEKREL